MPVTACLPSAGLLMLSHCLGLCLHVLWDAVSKICVCFCRSPVFPALNTSMQSFVDRD